MGHIRVTIRYLRVTIGYHRVTVGHPRVTIGHLRVTIGTFCSGAYRATFLVSSGKIGFNGLKIIVIPYRIFKLLIRKCFQAPKTT